MTLKKTLFFSPYTTNCVCVCCVAVTLIRFLWICSKFRGLLQRRSSSCYNLPFCKGECAPPPQKKMYVRRPKLNICIPCVLFVFSVYIFCQVKTYYNVLIPSKYFIWVTSKYLGSCWSYHKTKVTLLYKTFNLLLMSHISGL